MNPIKAAALLNAKVQNFGLGIGGERITDADIAHAMGKLWHEGARLYGRVKWARQDEYFDPLLAHIVTATRLISDQEGWTGVRRGEVERLARLALVESIAPRLCVLCSGRGSLMTIKRKPGRPKAQLSAQEVLKVDCPMCNGEGSRPHTEHSLARTAKIGRWRWDNVWSARYHDKIQPITEKYENLFWAGMKRVLSDWQKEVDNTSKTV